LRRADRPPHRAPRRDRQDRHAATLRHAFTTAALDAGVPLRDVQEAASHADPRTTMRYDRARGSLDRHAIYIVAAYVAGIDAVSRVAWFEVSGPAKTRQHRLASRGA